MKKLLPLLLILITANALAQYKPDTTRIKIVTATAEMFLNDINTEKADKNDDYKRSDNHFPSKYTQKQIERILDKSYVFFILNNTVWSSGFSSPFQGIIDACKYLEYNSNLSKNEINRAFDYMKNWYNYEPTFSDKKPESKNFLKI